MKADYSDGRQNNLIAWVYIPFFIPNEPCSCPSTQPALACNLCESFRIPGEFFRKRSTSDGVPAKLTYIRTFRDSFIGRVYIFRIP